MRYVRLVVAVLVLGLGSTALTGAPASRELDRARGALEANVGLGEALAGKAATPEEAAEAARLASEGEAAARAAVAEQPAQAEPHYVLGLALCLAYRPAPGAEASEGGHVALQRGGPNREEGLAELAEAVRLAPKEPKYGLGYAEALLLGGRAQEAVDRLRGMWKDRSLSSKEEGARAARLLGEGSLALGHAAEAEEWLDTALSLDPRDRAAARQLDGLSREDASAVHWHSLGAGLALARFTDQPILIWFYGCECSACEKLGKEVLTDPQVVAASKRFVCVKVDQDARRDLASQYGVRMCPTTVFLDPAGKERYRFVGYRSVSGYLAEIESSFAAEAKAREGDGASD